KPLGVGDVLDRTFNLYKQRPLLFIALSAIWYLLLVVVFVVLAIAVFAGAIASFVRESPTDIDPATLAGAISGFIAFLIVGILVAILLFSAQSASLIRAGALRYLGKEANVGEAFGSGVRASPRVFLAGVLAFVLLALLNVVLSALISAVFAIGGQADQGTRIVIQNLANFASTIVWAPVEWLAFTVLYYDLRVRKEAFDLQLAAEALPPS